MSTRMRSWNWLLGGSPAFNFSHYDVKALSEMSE